MKRLLTTFFALLMLSIAPAGLLAGQAAATNVFQGCTGAATASSVCKDAAAQKKPGAGNPIVHIIKVVIQILGIVIGVSSVIVIMISGLRMILSNGDTQATTNARNGIVYASVGLAVSLFAEAFVSFVLNRLQ